MTRCSCGARPEPGEQWCGTCGRRLSATRQPETITITQVLLVLSAVAATVGLLLTAAVASVAGSMIEGLSGGAGVPTEIVQRAGQVLASAGMAAIVIVAVDAWAFVALGRGQASARWVLTALAAVEALAATATMIVAGAPALAILIVVLIGLLVFDVPILVLLWGPESSRHWLVPPTRAAAPTATGAGGNPANAVETPPRPRLVTLTATGAIRVPQPRPAIDPAVIDPAVIDPAVIARDIEATDIDDPDAPDRDAHDRDTDDPDTERFALRHLVPVSSGRHSAPDS